MWVFLFVCYFNPVLYIQFKKNSLYSLEATVFHQDLIHCLLCRFQQGLHEVKGPIAPLFAASDQT